MQTMFTYEIPPYRLTVKYYWKELVECNMLQHSTNNFSGFLEYPVTSPTPVKSFQFLGYAVMFSHPQSVNGSKTFKQRKA